MNPCGSTHHGVDRGLHSANLPLIRVIWVILGGIWGALECSWGVLGGDMGFHYGPYYHPCVIQQKPERCNMTAFQPQMWKEGTPA